MKKRNIKDVIKELKSLGFERRYSWKEMKNHLTYYSTVNHSLLFSFNSVMFRFIETSGTFEYMPFIGSHYDEIESGLDIPSMLVLYK